MRYTPAPSSSSEAAAVATVRGGQQLRRAAVLHHPQAERAVVPADIVAADEPGALAGGPVDAARCIESLETSCSDDDHRSVDATLPERVRAVCESVLRFCESRLGFAISGLESRKPSRPTARPPAAAGGG